MKIAKISLAALVALGAFSVANATPLEEAIKNVDFSGFARYRYNNNVSGKKTSAADNTTTAAGHEFRFVGTFKAALDDNFFGVLSLMYKKTDGSGNFEDKTTTPTTYGDYTNTTGAFEVNEFYLGYKAGNTTVTAGKQLIGTYFDADLVGTGLRVINSDISGLTLAAVAFDALDHEGAEVDGYLGNYKKSDGTRVGHYYLGNNLYGLGVMGSYDPVAFKLWWAGLVDVGNLFALDAALNFDLDAVKLGLQGQYVYTNSDNKDFTDGKFYAVKGDVGAFGAGLSLGYINYESEKGNGTWGRSFSSIEENGKLISPSKLLFNTTDQYYTRVQGENDYFFVTAKYDFDKYGLSAGYIKGDGFSAGLGDVEDADRQEWHVQADYRYSKKLTFFAYYAANKDEKGTTEYKHDRFRFQTMYKF